MITSELLAKIFPGTNRKLRDRFLPAFNKFLPLYGIDNHLRVCAFLATGGVETDYLRTTVEYASGKAYEGRKDLGNVLPGDGVRFKGHGFFQTTGRDNHRRVTAATFSRLGIDFEKEPHRLAEIELAVESACIFWRDNKLSKYSDAGDFFGVSGVVNRGSAKKKALHYDKREALYKICRRAIPQDFSFVSTATVKPVSSPGNENGGDQTPAISPALPPSRAATSAPAAEPQALTPTGENAQLKEISNKYLRHTPLDSLKNILLVVSGRVSAGALAVWNLGLHGKVLTVLIAIAIAGPLIYALYFYRSRIVGWIKTIADSFLGN